MKRRNKRPQRRRSSRPPRTHHVYPQGWKAGDWVVPFEYGEHACIHHGHTDPDDHSSCGPAIFCCEKAASLYVELFPESIEARSEWQLTEAAHIATWLDAGVNVLYFVFCDPHRQHGVLAIGLAGQHARQVLFKRVSLERYADEARMSAKLKGDHFGHV